MSLEKLALGKLRNRINSKSDKSASYMFPECIINIHSKMWIYTLEEYNKMQWLEDTMILNER